MRDVERRRHVVYVTGWLEYHVRDGVGVGVRERGATDFLRGHLALGAPLAGAVSGGEPRAGAPSVGDSARFDGERALVTPTVRQIARPTKETTARYDRLTRG